MNIEKKYTPLSTILRYLYPSDICKRWHSIGFILQSYIPSKLAEILKKNDFRDQMCILFETNDVLCRCTINECTSIVVF